MANIEDLIELVQYAEKKYYENRIYEKEKFETQTIEKHKKHKYTDKNDIRNIYFQINWMDSLTYYQLRYSFPIISFEFSLNKDYNFNFSIGRNYKNDFSDYERYVYDNRTKDEIKKEIDRLVKQFLVELEI